MGSRSSGSTTQTNEPWSGIKPYLSGGYDLALDMYNQGGPSYYPGQTLADPSQYSAQGIDMLAQRALSGSPVGDAAQQQAQSTLGGDYLFSNPSMQALQPFASGQMTGSNPIYGLLGGMASGQNVNPALQMMQQTAQGGFLGSNPYLDQMYQRASSPVMDQYMQQVLPGLTSQFAGGGRLGGGPESLQGQTLGMATDSLGRTLGDMGANIYGNAYSMERQLMEQAQNNYGNLYNAGQGLQLGAASQIGGTYGNELGMQLSGAQAIGQPYQAERDLMSKYAMLAPSLAGMDYADISQLMGAGAAQEGYSQAGIDDQRARYDYNQQLPYSNLGQYFSYLSGVPMSGYGTQTTPTYSNPLAGAAGGAMAGSSLAAMMPFLGMSGPVGMGIGALAGLMFS